MAAQAPPVVRLEDARFGHSPRVVLDRVDQEVRPGEKILIVGPNGSGKSTLLATLAGLIPLLRGDLRVLGLDPLPERRKVHERTGHLGHRNGFSPELTGRENLLFHARLRGLGPDEAQRQLAAGDLLDAADRPVSEYSHGTGRRLGLAKALLGDPVLLLLDEPDAGLDPGAHARLRERIASPQRTVLMATHDPYTHLDWATSAWVLREGRLLTVAADGPGIPRAELERAVAGGRG